MFFFAKGIEFYCDKPEAAQITWTCQNRVGLEKKRHGVWESQLSGQGRKSWW